MVMLLYLVLAVLLYGILADRTDRAVEHEMDERRLDEREARLVEDFDARPDLGPRYGRLLGRTTRMRSRTRLHR
jgi:hypothetical protein